MSASRDPLAVLFKRQCTLALHRAANASLLCHEPAVSTCKYSMFNANGSFHVFVVSYSIFHYSFNHFLNMRCRVLRAPRRQYYLWAGSMALSKTLPKRHPMPPWNRYWRLLRITHSNNGSPSPYADLSCSLSSQLRLGYLLWCKYLWSMINIHRGHSC